VSAALTPADQRSFADLVSSQDAAMVVVTTAVAGERGGCLVGFHTQCSIEPNRYALWLSKANHTCRLAFRSTAFGVHFLGREQRDLAVLFGTKSGDDLDKFAHCDWVEGHGGVPVLCDCRSVVVGRRVAFLDEGSDHVCVVIEPVEIGPALVGPPMRQSDVADLDAGHAAEERPQPPTERAE
jgi:flavin reductase (DIM6/NTAB) family NADH-FMN oxidoreductase RutF